LSVRISARASLSSCCNAATRVFWSMQKNPDNRLSQAAEEKTPQGESLQSMKYQWTRSRRVVTQHNMRAWVKQPAVWEDNANVSTEPNLGATLSLHPGRTCEGRINRGVPHPQSASVFVATKHQEARSTEQAQRTWARLRTDTREFRQTRSLIDQTNGAFSNAPGRIMFDCV